ncbi:MAG: amidohydrolase [Desulfopila sp.]|jgi:hippurate hydrolase|nr:amidohydrolase [Desulfopila sp.]
MYNIYQKTPFTISAARKRWIRDIRRHIHAHPELSFLEKETGRFIQDKLIETGLDFEGGVAGTGVVSTLMGPPGRHQTVALRADMDALPVQEETALSFASTRQGVMHACGHDGHIAMLLGAAALLAEKELPGPVKFIFQPAEEHGNGAQHLIKAGVLENVEAVFAGHIDTHFPLGTITVDDGIICAWADPFVIRLRGRGGHAARPHESIDAVVAAADLVQSVQNLISRGADPNRAAVITIGCLQAGTAQNIIAENALLKGTIRSTDCQTRENTIAGLKRVVDSIGVMHRVEADLDFHEAVPAVINEKKAAETARVAASRTPGVLAVTSQGCASLGAEDFAFYQNSIPGCMVRFGASLEQGAGVAHSGLFDFNEDVLNIGALWYANVAWQWLKDRYEKV